MLDPLRNKTPLKTIGWKEVIDLPNWGIRSLLAKADTGARGSALDVDFIERSGADHVKFSVILDRKDRKHVQTVTAPIVRSTRIRSSNGGVQERFIVRTCICIGMVVREVDFSLVNRGRMICRVLLGRHALAGYFLVDSDKKYLHGPRRKPKPQPRKKSIHK